MYRRWLSKERRQLVFDDEQIDIVNKFTHQGVVLNFNENLLVHKKKFVSSILCYSSEMLGFHKAQGVKMTHIDIC